MAVEPGLSLFGFLQQDEAVNYLNSACETTTGTDLVILWNQARVKLGTPFGTPGLPEIIDMPVGHGSYLAQVKTNPRFDQTVGSLKWSFKMVELDPLVAIQYHVLTSHCDTIFSGFNHTPEVADVLPICLPHSLDEPEVLVSPMPNSVMMQASTLNLRLFGGGQVGSNPKEKAILAGIMVGVPSPLLHVIRLDKRCYLKNGYHRAIAARRIGVTHLPCLLIEATNEAELTLGPGYFDAELLQSSNPPLVAHFSNDRAYQIMIKRLRRIITLNWAEYAVPEPD